MWSGWDPHGLNVIDLRGNPLEGVETKLGGLLQLEWLNGNHWTEERRQAAIACQTALIGELGPGTTGGGIDSRKRQRGEE